MPGWPDKVFHTVNELANLWQVSPTHIQQWLSHGLLKGHIWLPMMSVYAMEAQVIGSQIVYYKEMRHWEGYTSIHPDHCRQLFKSECIHLRELQSTEGNSYLLLPESVESICLKQDDLVILDEERKAFEQKRNIRKHASSNVTSIELPPIGPRASLQKNNDISFNKVTFNGQELSFGAIQAKILSQLYQAALEDDPWQNGKQLLSKAGSQSFSLANVFKRNNVWRQLITSDGRGMYRMSEAFLSSIIMSTQ